MSHNLISNHGHPFQDFCELIQDFEVGSPSPLGKMIMYCHQATSPLGWRGNEMLIFLSTWEHELIPLPFQQNCLPKVENKVQQKKNACAYLVELTLNINFILS